MKGYLHMFVPRSRLVYHVTDKCCSLCHSTRTFYFMCHQTDVKCLLKIQCKGALGGGMFGM